MTSGEARPYNPGRMRKTPLFLGPATILGVALGCAEPPPPVAPTITPGPQVPVAVPAVRLDPVAEPSDIFVVARWKNPSSTMSGLSACAGVPDKLAEDNVRTLLDKALARSFRGGADGRQLADIIAMDAPVDLVVSLDTSKRTPQALYTFSVGLTSLDRAKQAASGSGELVELAPGLFRVGDGERSPVCVVGAAAGSAPARLICGRREKDVLTLGPYMARNMPIAEPPKQDLHAELRFTPIDARYGGDIRRGLGFLPNYARTQTIGDPRYDQALEEAARAIADEGAALAGDLDRVSIDLGVDPNACLTAKASMQLRGKSSWLAGTIADAGKKSGPPPAIFWRAPVDSDSASYGRGTDVTRYSGIFRTLRNLVEGKLAKEKIGSDADRKALASLINLPLAKDTSIVVASGHTHPTPKQIAPGKKLTDQQIADELVNGYLGWYVLGFDEGPDPLSKMIKNVVSVYGRKGLTDPLRKGLGRDGNALPTAKLVPAPRDLGRGALDVELKFKIEPRKKTYAQDTKHKPGKPLTFAIHLLLMPDGKRTWIGVGANRDDVVKHLKMSKASAPDSGTLMGRPELEELKSGKAVSSGFFTLSMFTRGLASVLGNPAFTGSMKPSASSSLEELGRTLNNLPHKGNTPIFMVTETTGGDGLKSETSLQVQKGSFEDIGVVLMKALQMMNKAGVLPVAKP
jgi:hypothetical protein